MGKQTDKQKFETLSKGKQFATVALAAAQIGLAAYAAFDLIRRPADQIKGTKAGWAPVLLVNWVGPAAYLIAGRRRPAKNGQPATKAVAKASAGDEGAARA